MSKVHSEVLQANANYSANFGEKGKLALPPARRFAILTCMDATPRPRKIRRTLRRVTLTLSATLVGAPATMPFAPSSLATNCLERSEFFVIHHTNCGMEFFTNDVMRGLLNSSLETAALTADGFKDVGKGPGSRAGEYIEWLTITDQKQAVMDDVARIRNHPLVPKSIPVYGYIYDVGSGKLIEVEGARAATAST